MSVNESLEILTLTWTQSDQKWVEVVR